MKMSRNAPKIAAQLNPTDGVQIKQETELALNKTTNFVTTGSEPMFASSSCRNDIKTHCNLNASNDGVFKTKMQETLIFKQEIRQINEHIDINIEPFPVKKEFLNAENIKTEFFPVKDELVNAEIGSCFVPTHIKSEKNMRTSEVKVSKVVDDDKPNNVKKDNKEELEVEEHMTIEIDPMLQRCAPVHIIKREENIKGLEVQIQGVNDSNMPTAKRKYTKKDNTKGKPGSSTAAKRKNNKEIKKVSEKNHVCNSCGNSYTNEFYLTRHMLKHTGEKPYACKTCDKGFVQKAHLVQHIRVHTGEKPYACNICEDKAFNHKYNYKTHMRKHLAEPSQKCNLCSSVFHQKGDLKRHMRTHTGEKPFSCNICDASFKQNCHLTQHIRIHTKEKPYGCDFCKQMFAKKKHLNNHIAVHAEEKIFSCSFQNCSKTFQTKSDFVNHSKYHTTEKQYSCVKCNKTFKQKGSLTTHTISFHEQNKIEDDLPTGH